MRAVSPAMRYITSRKPSNLYYAAIQAPLATPPINPKDKTLLRPVSELGKPASNAGGYSFLRRTEYISSETKARAEANAHAARANAKSPAAAKARKPTDTVKDDPLHMLRSAVKGFDIAYPENAYTGSDSHSNIRGAVPTLADLEAWKNPKHPSKTDVKLVDAYPLKPDLEAITDSGSYLVTKFVGNPTAGTKARDTRMDIGILYPRDHDSGRQDWDLFLPADESTANNFKRKFDVNDPDRDDPGLYTHKANDDSGNFKYSYLRTYDKGRRTETPGQHYREVALALHDPGNDGRDSQDKGAYYYPVATKMQLKPHRNKNLAQLGLASQAVDEELPKIDWINVTVREPEEEEMAGRAMHREQLEAEHGDRPDGET